MPTFKPFKGIRPTEDLLPTFPSLPLDGLAPEELEKMAARPDTYAHLMKPFILSKSKDVDRNLRKIRHDFEELLNQRKLTQDAASFYLYELTYPDKKMYRGLLGLVSLRDFWDGKIKRHESTIPEKKEQLAHYLDRVNLQADPVLLTYPANPKVELMMNLESKGVPVIKFEDEQGVRHKVWKIDNRLKIQQLKEVLDGISSFYIADGHHRIGSAALNAKNQNEKQKTALGNEGYNFVYSFIVSNQSIKINDYNRYLTTLNGLSTEEILEKLSHSFEIHHKEDKPYFPSKKFHVSMYLDGKFYGLHLKHDLRMHKSGNEMLDHDMVDRFIFRDIFGIEQTDSAPEIQYVKGTSSLDGILKLKEAVDEGLGKIAFGIYPIGFNEMLRISDQKIAMPPKCTYIEPKLISALLMYDMKP